MTPSNLLSTTENRSEEIIIFKPKDAQSPRHDAEAEDSKINGPAFAQNPPVLEFFAIVHLRRFFSNLKGEFPETKV